MGEPPHRSGAADSGDRRARSDDSGDSGAPVEARLGAALRERGDAVAVAESCTGGLVGSLITDVAGSSDYFRGGIVAYTNDVKRRVLGVSGERLERHGAVSEPVAREMARRVRVELDADWAVTTTGYVDRVARTNAGHGNGGRTDGRTAGRTDARTVGRTSARTPAGTAFVGVAVPGGGSGGRPRVDVERHEFDGSRRTVKARIARCALGIALDRVRSAAPR